MKRIIYDVPRWSVYMHRRERKLPLVKEDDSKDLRFEDEIFERLYSGEMVELGVERDHAAAQWVEQGHKMCDNLGLEKVTQYCLEHPFNAALATAWLMELIEEPLAGAKAAAEESDGGGSSEDGENELAADGFENVDIGPAGAGSAESGGGSGNQDKAKRVAEYLRQDPRLLKIALLAGRMRSSIITRQRSKTNNGAQEIVGITVGGELERLIPSELVRFAAKRWMKLAVMRDLVERKLMQYEMIAKEPMQQGPIVVCLDKSGSMELDDRDVWATAVALGLLDIAQRQKRAFAVVSFNHGILSTAIVPVGGKLDVRELMIMPDLGTDIGLALSTALDIVQKIGVMGDADLILISDGDDRSGKGPRVKQRAADMGVNIFGVGIATKGIKEWCHQEHVIEDVSSVDEATQRMLFTI